MIQNILPFADQQTTGKTDEGRATLVKRLQVATGVRGILCDVAGLLEWRELDYFAGTSIPAVQLLRFDADTFAASAFARVGILRPPGIARSVQKRQADYFYGRLAARLALANGHFKRADIGTGPNREPLWPNDVVGSITHSNGFAAATVAQAARLGGIGIDIEAAISASVAHSIERQIVSRRECEVLRLHPGLPYALAVTLVFSAKESFFKALFGTVGNYFGFDAIALESIDLEENCMHFRTQTSLCPTWPAGRCATVHFRFLSHGEVLTGFCFTSKMAYA